jgi:hypothetical protein
MTRYERKLFFERLMALREAYRAEAHESTGMSIEQAIDFAERTFATVAAAEAAATATSTSTSNGAPTAD